MIPTPDLSHLSTKDYDLVYEPAEDTFLLLDGLEADLDALKAAEPRICLEIGSGSGCISAFLSKILGPSSAVYICTDINPHANKATRGTGRQNQVELDPVNAVFALPLQQRLRGSVDVVLFNPPYVPTSFEEAQMSQNQGDIGGAWAGGWDGMAVTNKFLEQVEELLSPQGRFYLVALKQNNVPEIRQRMEDRFKLHSEVVIERRAGREYLYIIRFTR
ncbi:methylase [Ephemerocybe angulata]|uniref:Methylase n=1 Tax=Ephemerocybe angulata TaxID=980116 RepID=A0A8H6IL36_9AGAR|nr:methylase [Tulosesus angulatus]